MEFLQKYLFILLDIFRKSQQNKDIIGKREAWLALFSSDDPEMVIKLIEKYPEFYKIYEEGYEICLNMERVMEMFSKELYELDRNTVQYMIDEMQETIDVQRETIHKMQEEAEKRQEQNICGTVSILRNLNVSEQEIILQVCRQYQIDEDQVKKYLQRFDENI